VNTAPVAMLVPPPRMVYLHPGQYVAFSDSTHVTTILGSCVSVCLFDEHSGAGGVNHFVLPDVSPDVVSTRYAGPAFQELLRRLEGLGSRPENLKAKLFGGAGTFASSLEPSVGSRNVQAARALLTLCDIPIVSEDVGGSAGRKLLFETKGGAAWVRRLGVQS
jgi:chemotaxis receptor (MCP) glutamine deamidase CheD